MCRSRVPPPGLLIHSASAHSDALRTWNARRAVNHTIDNFPPASHSIQKNPQAKLNHQISPKPIRVDHVPRNSNPPPSKLHTPGLGETTTDFHIRTTEPTLSQLRLLISNLHHVRDTPRSVLASHAISPNRPLYTGATLSTRPAQFKHRHSPMDNGLRGTVKAWHG